MNVIKIASFIPVYLTASSVNNKSVKLYKKIITLFKWFFFVLISNSAQIRDITGI